MSWQIAFNKEVAVSPLLLLHRPVSRSWKRAEAVATFLLCVFMDMAVDAMNKRRSGVYLANARFRVTSCSGFSQSAQSKPQAPSRSFSGSI